MEPTEIELKNIGPIKHLAFAVDGPGVYVARGANGSGKSTMLRAVSKRLGGDVSDLSVYDGASRGTLALGEARLTVTQSRVANGGELEIIGIESALDISKLVDPGIKNAAKADDYRLKTLIGFAGIEPDPQIFHPIAGGEAAYLALGVDDKGVDLLTLAARVKRAIEAKARTHEETADNYAEKARACKSAAEGVPEGEADEKALAEALAKAQSALDAMNAENDRSDAARAAAELAAAQLREIGKLTDDPAKALAAAKTSTEMAIERRATAAEMRVQADRLDAEAKVCESDADQWLERAAKAQQSEKKRQQLAEAAAKAVPAGYDAGEIAAARAAVVAARKGVENGALIRQAAAKAAEAASHASAAKTASKLARKLRDAAGEVDGALSKLLPANCPLRVEAGRLVIESDRGKSELYADLSDGERWAVALQFAAQQLPRGGMLTLPQIAWESFAPALQTEIAGYVNQLGLVLITAAVADGPLRVEKLSEAPAGSYVTG